MINLLPPERKESYLFARRNATMIRAIVGLAIGLSLLLLAIGASTWSLQDEAEKYNNAIVSSQTSLAKQDEVATIARVQDITNTLKLVVKVLSQEVLFSELLRQIGTVMPNGAVLRTLSLNGDSSGVINIEAGAINYKSASQVQINLKDQKNKIFKSSDIISIDCTSVDPDYPCTVTLRAEFAPDNSFMLLSTSRKTTQ